MPLIITRTDGGVSIGPMAAGADPAAEVAKWEASSAFRAASFEVSDTPVALPANREFRGAWERAGAAVGVNMPAARLIHMDRIRVARDTELAAKDIEYIVADERGRPADKARIAAEKQALRDIPTTFDLSAATTPEALTALWPPTVPR